MSKVPPVSDHAVLRYAERICGLDVDRLRERIWQQARSAAGMGAEKTTVNGITFVIQKGVVVTVVSSTALPEPGPLDG